MPYIEIFGQYKHFLNDAPASAGQIVTIELLTEGESSNDFDSEAIYLAEKVSVVLVADGHLPANTRIWCNANSKYKFTDPDAKSWQAIVSYGDGSPKNITQIRAGGVIVAPPDTVLDLIETKIAEKSFTLIKKAHQNTNDIVTGDDTLFAVVPAGDYLLRAALFMLAGGLDGITVAVGGLNGLATVYFYGIDEANSVIAETAGDEPLSASGGESFKVVIEGATVSDGVTPIQIRFAGNSGAGARMKSFSTLTLSKI